MARSYTCNHFLTQRVITVRRDIFDRAIAHMDSLEEPATVRQIAAAVGCTEIKITDILNGPDGQRRVAQGKVALLANGPEPTWAKNHPNVAYGSNEFVLTIPDAPERFDDDIAEDFRNKMRRYAKDISTDRKSPATLQQKVYLEAALLSKTLDGVQLHKNQNTANEKRIEQLEAFKERTESRFDDVMRIGVSKLEEA